MSDSTTETVIETIKFAIVGSTGIVVNFAVLTIALYIFSFSEPISLALGIIFSMSTNYLLNRKWTFVSDNKIGAEYLQYILLNSLGILIQYFVALSLEIYFDSINFGHINFILLEIPTIYLASFTGILLGFVSNFIFSKYIIFS